MTKKEREIVREIGEALGVARNSLRIDEPVTTRQIIDKAINKVGAITKCKPVNSATKNKLSV